MLWLSSAVTDIRHSIKTPCSVGKPLPKCWVLRPGPLGVSLRKCFAISGSVRLPDCASMLYTLTLCFCSAASSGQRGAANINASLAAYQALKSFSSCIRERILRLFSTWVRMSSSIGLMFCSKCFALRMVFI